MSTPKPIIGKRLCGACGGRGHVDYDGSKRKCPSCLGLGWKRTVTPQEGKP